MLLHLFLFFFISFFFFFFLPFLVSIRPDLKQIFTGDLLYLSCGNAANAVKWYLNDTELQDKSTTLRMAPASSMDSGSYKCESNGVQSDVFQINVLGKCTT